MATNIEDLNKQAIELREDLDQQITASKEPQSWLDKFESSGIIIDKIMSSLTNRAFTNTSNEQAHEATKQRFKARDEHGKYASTLARGLTEENNALKVENMRRKDSDAVLKKTCDEKAKQLSQLRSRYEKVVNANKRYQAICRRVRRECDLADEKCCNAERRAERYLGEIEPLVHERNSLRRANRDLEGALEEQREKQRLFPDGYITDEDPFSSSEEQERLSEDGSMGGGSLLHGDSS
ncbi:hypothetical protein NLG97_g3622 [Lecanicillium saksenae]|uniref:Uncharacterized protein n=1 Tax=Lecanicillium saksenae TaxID=468837 RepID=A0ACC1QY59_9HYPO|nr:hypothetical protein NLG97_g3622 [Lecanicillium saksenae]